MQRISWKQIITLSSYGAQTYSHSFCGDPGKSVNVTSLNCRQVETVVDATSGPYSWWGNAGAFLVLMGIVAIPGFLGVAGAFYLLAGGNSEKASPSFLFEQSWKYPTQYFTVFLTRST